MPYQREYGFPKGIIFIVELMVLPFFLIFMIIVFPIGIILKFFEK